MLQQYAEAIPIHHDFNGLAGIFAPVLQLSQRLQPYRNVDGESSSRGCEMRFAKGFALVLAFAGAVALGVWIGPSITHREATVADTTSSATQTPMASVDKEPTVREAQRAATVRRANTAPRRTADATTVLTPAGATARSIPAAAPALHEQLKPLLNKGADMGIASEDFGTAEQFAAVAHAARNTKVPFMVLKHHVLYEGKSLEDVIHEFKPDLNAAAEAERARAEAKSEISALEG